MGAAAALLWEWLECGTFIRNSPEITIAYADTLGDLRLGLAGSVAIAALIVRAARWPAIMTPLGDRDWWRPSWLEKLVLLILCPLAGRSWYIILLTPIPA